MNYGKMIRDELARVLFPEDDGPSIVIIIYISFLLLTALLLFNEISITSFMCINIMKF